MAKDKRDRLEDKIIEASESMNEILDIENWEWLPSPKIDDFIEGLYQLRLYYRDTGDPQVSRKILLEYVIWTRYFNTIVTDKFEPSTGEAIPQSAKDLAQQHINMMQYLMDKIVEYEG
ncbi:MAG: hypothetical protein AAFV98_03495 [Chloroflexota bacterium]